GAYHGAHYKSCEQSRLVGDMLNYAAKELIKAEHTFMMNVALFTTQLSFHHSEAKGQPKLIIVCNDCNHEFTFSYELYGDLNSKMMRNHASEQIDGLSEVESSPAVEPPSL